MPQKNIRLFRGQPLLAWSIKAAQKSSEIDKVVVSTDDAEAAKLAEEYGASVFWRPNKLSSDTSSTFDVLKYVCCTQCRDIHYEPKYLVLLQPTSPLRERNLITRGLDIIRSDPKADRLLELNSLRLFTGKIDSGYWVGDYAETTRSQELPHLYFPSGRLYIYKCSTTILRNDSEGKNTKYLIGDYESNINIDYEHDFNKLDYVFTTHSARYRYLLN